MTVFNIRHSSNVNKSLFKFNCDDNNFYLISFWTCLFCMSMTIIIKYVEVFIKNSKKYKLCNKFMRLFEAETK